MELSHVSGIVVLDENSLKKKFTFLSYSTLHVIADFDKTLTKAFENGRKIVSSYALIRSGKYLTPQYVEQSHALFDQYYSYEIAEDISEEERHEKMNEWWQKHYQLMVDCGLTKAVIEDIARSGKITLREGCVEFLDILHRNSIPLLIFSAGQGDVIREFLLYSNLLTPNIHIISNFYRFDAKGRAMGYNTPFIHTFNKNEHSLQETPYAEEIIHRPHVLLLGDTLGDVKMAEGIHHETIIKVGFLNENKEKFLSLYKEAFDVVIPDDGSLEAVNSLLRQLPS